MGGIHLRRSVFGRERATGTARTLQMRLVTKEGNIILKRNKEGGNSDELVRTCFTDDATQKRGKGSLPFGGEWRPKKGKIDKVVEHYPGTSSNYAKMKVKDHVNNKQ